MLQFNENTTIAHQKRSAKCHSKNSFTEDSGPLQTKNLGHTALTHEPCNLKPDSQVTLLYAKQDGKNPKDAQVAFFQLCPPMVIFSKLKGSGNNKEKLCSTK